MYRITMADAEAALERLCKYTGHTYHPRDVWPRPVGAWFLDRYNGIRVAEQLPSSGGEGNPMGSQRYTPREFVDAVYFMTNALANTIVFTGQGARGFPIGTARPIPIEHSDEGEICSPPCIVCNQPASWVINDGQPTHVCEVHLPGILRNRLTRGAF